MTQKVIKALGGDVKGKTVAVLGLTFKPETDDMRDSPSITIVEELVVAGAIVRAFDPEGMENAKDVLPPITYCEGAYDAATGADAIVVVTEWNEFRALDLKRIKSVANGAVLVDLRNIYRKEEVARHGFTYTSIGRPAEDII